MHESLKLNASANLIASDDGRMFSASAARNSQHIIDELAKHCPKASNALEIASGTGEHAVAIAQRLPELIIQPTDVDPARFESIEAWRKHVAYHNLKSPILLDATSESWSKKFEKYDLVSLINLLHLISDKDCETLIQEVSNVLSVGGCFAFYGPFMRPHGFASEGDKRFHESLRAQNPSVGYKQIDWVREALTRSGCSMIDIVEMPANNLMIFARKS